MRRTAGAEEEGEKEKEAEKAEGSDDEDEDEDVEDSDYAGSDAAFEVGLREATKTAGAVDYDRGLGDPIEQVRDRLCVRTYNANYRWTQ